MAIPITKTLFLGIGGFGKATLRALRRKIYENFGFYRIPALEYMVLDTDRDQKAMMYKSAYDSIDRHVSFNSIGPSGDGEFVDLHCDRRALESLYRGNVSQEVNDALAWFDPRLKELGARVLEDGAGGIRSFGKLAFLLGLLHGNQIMVQALQNKLLRLHNLAGPPDKAWDGVDGHFTLDAENRIDIFIFCSTAGGTGSGIFLDLAYLLTGLFKSRGIDQGGTADIGDKTLYLYLPDIILEDERSRAAFKPPEFFKRKGMNPQKTVKAGTYASLSELERFQLSRTQSFSFDGGWRGTEFFIPDWKPYKDPYSPIKEDNDEFVGVRAFDWAYLIGNRSTEGVALKGAEDAIEMVADKIYMLLVEREQGKLLDAYKANRGLYVLPDKLAVSGGSQTKEFARHYGGFGLSKIYIGESQIQRWASYYLASKYLEKLLQAPEIMDTEAARIVAQTWDGYSWNTGELFNLFSSEMMSEVRARFLNVTQEETFFSLVNLGVDYQPQLACYEKVDLVDSAFGEWGRQFESDDIQYKIDSMLENWIVQKGVKPALQIMNGLVARARTENEEVRKNLSDAAANLDSLTPKCRSWLSGQQNKLDWLGESNIPKHENFTGWFSEAGTALDHIQQLSKIPDAFADKVEHALKDRFDAAFLNDRVGADFREIFSERKNVQKTKRAIGDVQRGVVNMVKEVLKRVDVAQKNLMDSLEKKRDLISSPTNPNASGTLIRTLKDILSREYSGHQVGIQPELEDLGRIKNDRSRNIYCGAPYQEPNQLKEPNPDPETMAKYFKEGFGQRKPEGAYAPLDWIWQVTDCASLDNGTKQWISILVDRGVTELKTRPTLSDYYNSLKTKKAEQFQQDLQHILRTGSSYLRHRTKNFGEVSQTKDTRMVFTPLDIQAETEEAMRELTANAEVSAYNGRELVVLTLEDGVPLPLLDIMDDLHNAYQSFEWKRAVWSRKGSERELISKGQDLEIEKEIYLGVLIGNIHYDRASRNYKMTLERKGLGGVHQDVPLGKSIADVKTFFYQVGEKNFIDPYGRLKEGNTRLLREKVVLRKLYPLLRYYEKYFFQEDGKSDDQKSRHSDIIREIEERRLYARDQIVRLRERKGFNEQCQALCSWLHAFCEIVPILEKNDPNNPDKDWLPVLMRKWSPELSQKTLLWHNMNFAAKLQGNIPSQERDPYRYAMEARSEFFPTGKELYGWNEEDPTIIPEEIFNIVWMDEPVDAEMDEPVDTERDEVRPGTEPPVGEDAETKATEKNKFGLPFADDQDEGDGDDPENRA